VEGCIEIIIQFVDTDPSTKQQLDVFLFVSLDSDVKRSIPEVSDSIDIYSGVVDQPANNLN